MRALLAAWDRYWFGPVAAIRPYLLTRTVYAVLAFDLWIVTLPRGSRYGFGGFDVAHFAWLDAVRPQPTPAVYVGLLLFIGFLALTCALCDPGRWARALVAVLHTYSWSMSLHDSYQHHYFLSVVLVALVFFPRGTAAALGAAPGGGGEAHAERAQQRPPAVSTWAFALLGVNVAIVYAFAGASKLDMAWRTGEVLKMAPLSQLGAIQAWTEGWGLSPDVFWSMSALGVVALEWTVAAGYLVCVHRDRRRLWVSALAWVAFALAVGFHASAEAILALRIGWFTYYMIAIACVYLLPSGLLHAIAGPALRVAARLGARIEALARERARLGTAASAAGALAIAATGLVLDLPGAPAAGGAAALAILGGALCPRAVGRPGAPLALGLSGALAAAAMGISMWASEARYEYYMSLGRQLDRFGQRAEATDVYAHAHRYGASRLDGLWSSAGSILRVRVRDGEARAVFIRVGEGAQQLGFKPGDVSFVARVNGPQLDGRLTLRYRGGCYPEGRVVPLIGILRRDGDVLLLHFYNLALGADCADAGSYQVSDTTWERVVGAR